MYLGEESLDEDILSILTSMSNIQNLNIGPIDLARDINISSKQLTQLLMVNTKSLSIMLGWIQYDSEEQTILLPSATKQFDEIELVIHGLRPDDLIQICTKIKSKKFRFVNTFNKTTRDSKNHKFEKIKLESIILKTSELRQILEYSSCSDLTLMYFHVIDDRQNIKLQPNTVEKKYDKVWLYCVDDIITPVLDILQGISIKELILQRPQECVDENINVPDSIPKFSIIYKNRDNASIVKEIESQP
jgi:hypothetical protein